MPEPKKAKIRFKNPDEPPVPGREVRIVGSTIIVRVENCMLDKPRPARPIPDTK